MANAAVIQRVADAAGGFADAAPGHRFNLYFPIWQDDWKLDKNHKAQAIGQTLSIQPVADLLKGLRERQRLLLETLPETDHLSLPARSTSPFATGLGNEHPVENGFAFLTPYGLPYLAGSGVKGVLRRAAEELALFSDEDADPTPLTPTPLPEGEGLTLLDVWWLFGFEGAAGAWWSLSRKEERELPQEWKAIRADWKTRFDAHLASLADRPDWLDFIGYVLPKGPEKDRYLSDPALFVKDLDGLRQDIHLRGALEFWDVFPDPKGGKLAVEIMTPHYSDYYQGKTTPHDAGQPNPIPFLAVPAGSEFEFHVICRLQRLPEFLRETWRAQLRAIFAHTFDWLGFGAKTAVGYGAMRPKPDRFAQQGDDAGTERVAASRPTWEGAVLEWAKGNQTLTATGPKGSRASVQGRTNFDELPPDMKAKLDKGKRVSATVEVEAVGNAFKLIRVVPGASAP